MTDLIGPYGSGEYGTGPYGSAYPPFGLESVTPLTPTLLRVRYTALFDPAFSPLLSVANYSIFPALTIFSVILETDQTVILVTSPQTEIVYTLTIFEAKGFFGQPLDPALDEKTFLGIPVAPTFYAVATRRTRVRAVFSEPMLQNADLIDPAKYVLTDLENSPIPILSVVTEQPVNPVSVLLTLGANLVDERHYRLTTLSGIVTATLHPLNPDTSVFQWNENLLRTSIPLNQFSGEVQNGLYGIHGGLVFFSPALVTAAPNSIIQVDEVDVCTKAFDQYHFPPVLDPPVLFTHGAGVVPTPNVTRLNTTASLWAKFPRLFEAKFELAYLPTDTVPTPVESSCVITLAQTWDLTFVSLMNNPNWKIFDNLGNPPAYFITANNLAPIPPGAGSSITVLGLLMQGNSALVANATV